MSEILFQYNKIYPTTWVYLSSLLIITVFFKFNRIWSVRNLDLVLLILLAPGLLMVNQSLAWQQEAAQRANAEAALENGSAVEEVDLPTGVDSAPAASLTEISSDTSVDPANDAEPPAVAVAPGELPTKPASKLTAADARNIAYLGYLWLFVVSLVWLVRMLLDPTMVRRPLLEPNLSSGGLIFLGGSLFIFLMANVITSNVSPDDLRGAQGAKNLMERQDNADQAEDYSRFGPGYHFLHILPSIPTTPFVDSDRAEAQQAFAVVSKTMAILSHLAVVAALVIIGYWHFENVKMGIGAATLYLMLPYTAQMTGHVDHVLPAALLLWAIVLYRRPALAGIFIGLAMSVFYYPVFLLPLWISFYWQRGLARFGIGAIGSIAVMVLTLVFVSSDLASFWYKFQQMFALWIPKTENLAGVWGLGWDPWYRLPVIAGCVVLAGGLAIWPAHKNLGTLLSCSAAMMVAVQFWHGFGQGGGMYMAWYLPLLLMTVFRPNLEDRVALTVLGEGWFLRRRARLSLVGRAA